MIREMTLGQYYKADSILHKLDPRVKLLGTLLFVAGFLGELIIRTNRGHKNYLVEEVI